MLCERVHCFESHDVAIVVCGGEPWFRASDVAYALGYKDSAQAIRKNVSEDYTRTADQLRETACEPLSADLSTISQNVGNATRSLLTKSRGFKQPLYISEPGVYELVWHSRKPEAIRFRRWVVEEILPEIRKTGAYVRKEQVSLKCEYDLHSKVVDFCRTFFPEAILVAGLGELQDTPQKRIESWRKGYTKGQCDLMILNRSARHSGLAIEFKSPTGLGVLSPKQASFMDRLAKERFATLVSDYYDAIIVRIVEFREAVRRCRKPSLC